MRRNELKIPINSSFSDFLFCSLELFVFWFDERTTRRDEKQLNTVADKRDFE